MNKEKLIETLSVPTWTGKEIKMINFIENELNQIDGLSYYRDNYDNIYVTKGIANFYPLVIAHMDTVHYNNSDIIVHEISNETCDPNYIRDKLEARNTFNERVGIGGDDKAGVFVCLELLKEFDNIKAAFFVSEENGCVGSLNSDENFFNNVGYCLQFDAPYNNLVSQYCNGEALFEITGDFFDKINTVFTEYMPNYSIDSLKSHPYTDVFAMRLLYDFSCVNYSVGYYNMHTKEEYVIVQDVERCLLIAKKIIESCGYEQYYFPRSNNGEKIRQKREYLKNKKGA